MDPLTNLKDIHLPEPIHNYPVAPGWWLLLLAVASLVTWLLIKAYNKRKFYRVKHQALQQLQNREALSTEQSIAIIKFVVMHYFNRQSVAGSHGSKLVKTLSEYLPSEHQAHFNQLAEQAVQQHYRANASQLYAEQMQQAALYWLHHCCLPSYKRGKSL
ncbi:DUF4381 domain-containing protein [Thalassotalea maritima]|uniref:DUF4381 domain-containing protein n=1 Tax=Thalassotalea maritima TaxID=3242416 RepID=UPI003526F8B7